MRVYLSRFNIAVARSLLNGAYVSPRFEQVSGKRMPEAMTADMFMEYSGIGDGKAFRLEGVLIIESMGKGTSNWFF